MPPITGLDASLAGLQLIVQGDQYMTVYNPFRSEAEHAAEAAFDLASGKTPQATTTVNGIPSFLNQPVAVNIGNIMDTIIKDEFYKVVRDLHSQLRRCLRSCRHQVAEASAEGSRRGPRPIPMSARHRHPIRKVNDDTGTCRVRARRSTQPSPCSRCEESPRPSALCRRSPTLTSMSIPARCSPSSATTAPESRRW